MDFKSLEVVEYRRFNTDTSEFSLLIKKSLRKKKPIYKIVWKKYIYTEFHNYIVTRLQLDIFSKYRYQSKTLITNKCFLHNKTTCIVKWFLFHTHIKHSQCFTDKLQICSLLHQWYFWPRMNIHWLHFVKKKKKQNSLHQIHSPYIFNSTTDVVRIK